LDTNPAIELSCRRNCFQKVRSSRWHA